MIENILLTSLPLMPFFLGIYIVFLMRSDLDLTLAGTYGVTSGVTATLLVSGVPPVLVVVACLVIGAALGLVTFLLKTALRIPVLMCGLIMSISLYTVALRAMDKRPTISLINTPTLFDYLGAGFTGQVVVLGVCAIIVFVLVGLFLKTDLGLAVRASAKNSQMAKSNAFDDRVGLAIALALANALAGLAGSLVVQSQSYAAVSLNVEIAIAGIGGGVIGALILRPNTSTVTRMLVAVVLGGFIYETVSVLALEAGLDPVDLKLVTGVTLVAAIALQAGVRHVGDRLRGRSSPPYELIDEQTAEQVAQELTGRES